MILCKRLPIFLFTFIMLIASSLFGQDAHYSQFYANPLYLNPAFAGTNNCPRFSVNFRDQWPAIKGNFISFSGSYDQHINALHGGFGALFSADLQGYNAGSSLISTYNASIIYNFRAQISHNFNLQFALQCGYLTSAIHWENLQFVSGSNANSYQSYYAPKSQFDAAFGFVGYSPYLYFGVAMHHLFPTPVSFVKIMNSKFTTIWQPKITAHIGGKITISQKMRAEVNAGDIFFYPNLVFISQGKFNYLHEGFYFNFYPFTIGTWLRHDFKSLDALIISCGMEYKFLRVGYSYDFSLSKLERTGGAHEISLQFTIPCEHAQGGRATHNKKKMKHKLYYSPLECPKF